MAMTVRGFIYWTFAGEKTHDCELRKLLKGRPDSSEHWNGAFPGREEFG
jgi:hypothetical protein